MSNIAAKRRLDYQPPAYTISSVNMDVILHPSKTSVTTVTQVERQGNHQEPLRLDGEKLLLKRIAIDGKPYTDYQIEDKTLVLSGVPERFKLTIETEINPQNNKALEGLYLSNGVYCTQCEAEGFRRITYFLDRPDVLATYSVTITGDKQSLPTLLANGNKVDEGDNNDGTHWVTWQDPHPKPCYLFALVAGEFDRLTDNYTTTSGRNVALELYVDKGKQDKGQFALESLKRAMKWDEDTFGLEYDLDIYMVVAVDFFNMGAMENKGLNIFNSKFVLADQNSATDEDFFNVESVIAHEYFHNWTGNRVTCRDWFQLSLKEGLTVFRDQQFSADMTSPLSNRIKHVRVMREHQFAEDASAMSHPIRPDEVIEMNNFYTVTVYDKGAEVIRMFHTLLGADGFRQGMDEYFRRHDGQAVTCDDFIAAMQSVTDRDLSHFARWYSQSGTPIVGVERVYDKHNRTLHVTLSQHTPPTADQRQKLPLYIPVAFECIDATGNHYKDDEGVLDGGLVIVDKPSVSLTFTDVPETCLPVVLGNFSAPVKIDSSFSASELLQVFNFAHDAFNRWDAIQCLYDRCIQTIENDEPIADAIWQQLESALLLELDNTELLGECLVIPSFETLCQSRHQVDVFALNSARTRFCEQFAAKLGRVLKNILDRHPSLPYSYAQADVQTRRCKNAVLRLLAYRDDSASLLQTQFEHADNMTDTLGALKAAQTCGGTLFESLMASFEQTWNHDPLVLDKWFALHATTEREDILSHLTLLQSHPQFAMGNPNRVRALIGSFAFYNPTGFHRKDGTGYKYVTDYLIALDKQNPQVAARIVTPLTQWQNYAPDYQTRMKAQLNRLLCQENLSTDVFEKVSKSLAYEQHHE
ncbi:aminopeptidase N [Aestuariibacter sp. A3R04]|uniref:aminopeptidase N n=1 Tax=Aestuariibacter sp. A3R04 TaxID=2841571 RepID=UPI001C07FB02|nr:aminopeptidase N [Aestuariibacter sp. A3R04]MBU3022907.1 aminopeptidase N [Aestuariibacter sp. A3R04]